MHNDNDFQPRKRNLSLTMPCRAPSGKIADLMARFEHTPGKQEKMNNQLVHELLKIDTEFADEAESLMDQREDIVNLKRKIEASITKLGIPEDEEMKKNKNAFENSLQHLKFLEQCNRNRWTKLDEKAKDLIKNKALYEIWTQLDRY